MASNGRSELRSQHSDFTICTDSSDEVALELSNTSVESRPLTSYMTIDGQPDLAAMVEHLEKEKQRLTECIQERERLLQKQEQFHKGILERSDKENAALQSKYIYAKAYAKDLKERLKTKEAEIKNLEAQIESQQKLLQGSDDTDLKEEAISLQGKLGEIHSRETQMKEDFEELQENYHKRSREFHEQSLKIHDLQTRNGLLEQQLEGMRAETQRWKEGNQRFLASENEGESERQEEAASWHPKTLHGLNASKEVESWHFERKDVNARNQEVITVLDRVQKMSLRKDGTKIDSGQDGKTVEEADESEIEVLRSQLSAAKTELQETQKMLAAINEISTRVVSKYQNVCNSQGQQSKDEQTVEKLQEVIIRLEQELEAEEKRNLTERESSTAHYNQLYEDYRKLGEEYAEYQTNVRLKHQECDVNRENMDQIAELTARSDDQEKLIQDLKDQVLTLQESDEDKSTRITALTSSLEEEKNKFSQKRQEAKERKKELNIVKGDRDDMSAEVDDLKRKLVSQQREITTLKKGVDAAGTTSDKAREQTKLKSREIDSLRKKLASSEENIEMMQQQLECQTREIEAQKEEIAERKQAYEDERMRSKASRDEKRQLQTKLDAMDSLAPSFS